MIKAVLFDYDGVITKGVDNEWVAGRLARNLSIPKATASSWVKEVWLPFLRGTISEEEIWRLMEGNYEEAIDGSKRGIWFTWDEVKPLPEMIDLVRSLKQNGYTVGVLSNVFNITRDLVKANGGYDEFDFVVASCDLGFKKPEPEIFQVALEKLEPIKPEEVVFFDDHEDNSRAAEKLGIKGIHVTNQHDAIAVVKSLLASQGAYTIL